MKRLFFALALAALALPAAQNAKAQGDVSIDFFYDNLASDGSWIEVGDYGYCWQPQVAVADTSWRPYADGSWAYTDVGWTWVSNERFGWATYHYGRWVRLSGRGWIWVPGREWAPAWVSWRTGGDYVGWAPLPPRYAGGGGEVVYEGRPIGGAVDIEFDIGPAYYNFVNIRYIGEPSLRRRIYAPTQNITYITRTVNVTNITYNNTVINNYGPDYNRVNAYAEHPVRRLRLQRENNVDYRAAAQAGTLTRVQGDSLVVAAPMTLQKPAQPVAPKVVKERIAQPKPETGWSGVKDPKAKTALQDKMKKEDPKAVPPPTVKPKNPAALNAANGGDAAAAPNAPAAADSPASGPASGKGKGKRGAANEPPSADEAAAAGGTGASGVSDGDPQPAKGKNKKTDKANRADTAANPAGLNNADAPTASAAPVAKQPHTKGKNNKPGRENAPKATPAAATSASPNGATPNANADQARGKGKNKGAKSAPASTPVPAAAAPKPVSSAEVGGAPANGNAKGKGKGKRAAAPQAPKASVNARPGGPSSNGARANAATAPAGPQAHGKKANKPNPPAAQPAQPRSAAPQASAPQPSGKRAAVPGQPTGKGGKADKKKKKDEQAQPQAQ